jgi:radical SAM superfamily enzyme YgiQ (UPF0313 family)
MDNDVLLVGYDNQENLGLRSILAYLRSLGHRADLIPLNGDVCDPIVVASISSRSARLIAFSIIFQYSISEFKKLLRQLRECGIDTHFTAGGHFPSLEPRETLNLLPELDSVIRFEGEEVITELLGCVDQPERWEQIGSLAFRRDDEIVLTPPRPLIEDLDRLPNVVRDIAPRLTSTGVSMASMLASRGCPFNCSFCTIRQFYEAPPGELRRLRSPKSVAEEMLMLYGNRGVRMFVFQDDDFPVRTLGNEWLSAFLKHLRETGISDQVVWKISCRVDDLNEQSLEAMVSHGLIAIYFGIESGNATGLRTLNKQVSVARNLATIQMVKKFDLAMAAGFMLFDPSSTVETIHENIKFLREIGGDGYYPINFCKMLPYAGTPIEAKLRQEGRLKGTIHQPDYDLLDPQLDWYAFLVQQIFSQRNFSSDGLQVALQEANFNERLGRALGLIKPTEDYRTPLKQLIKRANTLCFETLENLLDAMQCYGIEWLLNDRSVLLNISENEWRGEAEIELALTALDRNGNGNTLGLSELLGNKHSREQKVFAMPGSGLVG